MTDELILEPAWIPAGSKDEKGNLVWTKQEWQEYQDRCHKSGYSGRISGVMVAWDFEP